MCETKTYYTPLLVISYILILGAMACSGVSIYYSVDASVALWPQIYGGKILPILVNTLALAIVIMIMAVMQVIHQNYYVAYKTLLTGRSRISMDDDSTSRLLSDI